MFIGVTFLPFDTLILTLFLPSLFCLLFISKAILIGVLFDVYNYNYRSVQHCVQQIYENINTSCILLTGYIACLWCSK